MVSSSHFNFNGALSECKRVIVMSQVYIQYVNSVTADKTHVDCLSTVKNMLLSQSSDIIYGLFMIGHFLFDIQIVELIVIYVTNGNGQKLLIVAMR